jgi:hypothetical protein
MHPEGETLAQCSRIMAKFLCEGTHLRVKKVHRSRGMKTQRPIAAEDEHRVVPFRPRNGPARHVSEGGSPPVPLRRHAPASLDLSRYERPREQPDDFRHRILANIAAIAFTIALTAIGIWLAMSIADLRKTQDCVLTGRRDCARIITETYTP